MSNAAPSEAGCPDAARERIALPVGAVFEAALEDVTRGDVGGVIGRTRMDSPGNPPFKFTIPTTPRDRPVHRCLCEAVPRDQLTTTDTHYPVLSAGQPSHVDLLMRMPPRTEPAASTATLENTY
jgi:putative lipoprotein